MMKRVLIVASGCIALTILGIFSTRQGFRKKTCLSTGIIRHLAIGVTTHLALENQSAEVALHKGQAELAQCYPRDNIGQLTVHRARSESAVAGVISNAQACRARLGANHPIWTKPPIGGVDH